MSMQYVSDPLPRIFISQAEERRLWAIAKAGLKRQPEAASSLLSELERAEIVPAIDMPPDVVRLDSTIEFEIDDGRRLTVQLVLPERADINAGRISVLTPVGAALIGLSKGQSFEWTGHDGVDRILTVLTVTAHAASCTKRPTIITASASSGTTA